MVGVAEDDVGLATVHLVHVELGFDKMDAVFAVGVELARTMGHGGGIDAGDHVQVLVPALEQAVGGIAQDDVVAAAKVGEMFPRAVSLDDGLVAVALRLMPPARDVLHLLDDEIIEEELGELIDDKVGTIR